MAAAKYKMISIPEAQATVLKHAAALPTEVVPLASALGRILSQEVVAQEPLPPFPASIKVNMFCQQPGTYPAVLHSFILHMQ
jgi:gephyrin